MEKRKEQEKDAKSLYPYVLIRIDDGLYTINSRYIISIMKLPKYNRIPGAPKEIMGVIDFRGEAVAVIDMRVLFGIKSIKEEYKEFTEMFDKRKQDHIYWVDELERSIDANEEFKLATDPHKCQFGQWYYNFHSNSPAINHHMKKIEEPHRKLHESAINVEKCNQQHDACTRETCLKDIMKQAKDEYMPEVLRLLDEAKDVFLSSFSEMAIVLEGNGKKIVIVIDEVLSVESLSDVDKNFSSFSFDHSDYICDVKQQERDGELILELDDELLLADADKVQDIADKA